MAYLQQTIKITIKEGSKSAVAFERYLEDRRLFYEAVKADKVSEYIKEREIKFATPIFVK